MRNVGRWKKYRNAAEFAEAVQAYFDGISYYDAARKPDVWVSGKYVPGDEIIGRNGEKIMVLKYAVPPSITGLQNYLGISRQTWSMYAQRDGYKEVIERARMTVEEYLTQQLIIMGRDCKGVIFSLENNFNYASHEKRDETITHTGDIGVIPAEEKLKMLKEIAHVNGVYTSSTPEGDPSGAESVSSQAHTEGKTDVIPDE